MDDNSSIFPLEFPSWSIRLSMFSHKSRLLWHPENRLDECLPSCSFSFQNYFASAGITLTRFCPWITSNSTMPSLVAKMVSSLPRSTFKPGLIRVPRCRTRIFPDKTYSPAYFLTPKRWALLSLPFLAEPPPFLCAIPSSLCCGFLASRFFYTFDLDRRSRSLFCCWFCYDFAAPARSACLLCCRGFL